MALLIDHPARRSAEHTPRLFPDTAPAPARAPHAPEPAVVEAPAPAAGPTLDDLISGTWSRLTAGVETACPVCEGELAPRWSAGAGVVGGRCRDCGTELS